MVKKDFHKGAEMRISLMIGSLMVCAIAVAGAMTPAGARQGSSGASWQQASGHSHVAVAFGPGFAPLEAWKAAVISGDSETIAKFYSTNPPVKVTVASEPTIDTNEEPVFWAGLKSAGMTEFNPKILEIVTTKNGVKELVMRVEGTMIPRTATVGGASMRQNVVAGMQMVWAEQPGGWRILEVQRSAFKVNAVRTLPQPSKPNVNLYPPPSEAQRELDEGLAAAVKSHKRVIVVFGANWCYDCHVLDTTFRSKEFAPLVQANYEVVHVNIGDEGKDNGDLAARLGVGLAKGIPSLAVLDSNGTVVFAQKNGEFESSVKIGPADVKDFLEKWRASSR
jgi:thioredoxin 1